jgi:primary-amine oxidase
LQKIAGFGRIMLHTEQGTRANTGHPLDPLSESEVALAAEILRTSQQLGPHARFTHVQLEEPAKADVLGWQPNSGFSRQAAATLFDCKTGATHVATVDLGSRTVVAISSRRTAAGGARWSDAG